MKKTILFFVLLFVASTTFISCEKMIDYCPCKGGGGKDTCNNGGGTDTTSFASTAQLKLDSFRNGQIGIQIGAFGQFYLNTYKRPETFGTGISGGTQSNLYDLNNGWRSIKYNDYAPEADAYIIYKEGETLLVASTVCGGTINLHKTLIFIPQGRSYYTSAGWELISNQTLLFDENHPLPFHNSIICSSGTVNAASNESWAMYFAFY